MGSVSEGVRDVIDSTLGATWLRRLWTSIAGSPRPRVSSLRLSRITRLAKPRLMILVSQSEW